MKDGLRIDGGRELVWGRGVDDRQESMSYGIETTLTNETEGHNFSEWSELLEDWLLKDDGTPDMGHVFRLMREEYGRCVSSVYVDTDAGMKRVGWFFVSRQQYEDTHEPYLRGAWVTVYKVVEPAHVETREFVEVGS